MLVVVFQKEQQSIEWEDEEEDSIVLTSAEDVEL
jgi:hypothetical protein